MGEFPSLNVVLQCMSSYISFADLFSLKQVNKAFRDTVISLFPNMRCVRAASRRKADELAQQHRKSLLAKYKIRIGVGNGDVLHTDGNDIVILERNERAYFTETGTDYNSILVSQQVISTTAQLAPAVMPSVALQSNIWVSSRDSSVIYFSSDEQLIRSLVCTNVSQLNILDKPHYEALLSRCLAIKDLVDPYDVDKLVRDIREKPTIHVCNGLMSIYQGFTLDRSIILRGNGLAALGLFTHIDTSDLVLLICGINTKSRKCIRQLLSESRNIYYPVENTILHKISSITLDKLLEPMFVEEPSMHNETMLSYIAKRSYLVKSGSRTVFITPAVVYVDSIWSYRPLSVDMTLTVTDIVISGHLAVWHHSWYDTLPF